MINKVHHNTRKAARIALAKEQISLESYEAILRGELSLADGKALGREGGPDTPERRSGPGAATKGPRRAGGEQGVTTPPEPTSRISKDDTRQFCWCGCEQLTSSGKRWRPGHDQRGKGIIKRAVVAGKADELPGQLRDYGAERGLI